MVMVKYTGLTLYTIGGFQGIENYRFESQKNVNVKDEDFYVLMKSKTFAHRVENGLIIVPRDFPLDKPKSLEVLPKTKKEKEKSLDDEDGKDSLSSLKSVQRLIQESNDIEFLKELAEKDSRDKVKEAVSRKLKSLEY